MHSSPKNFTTSRYRSGYFRTILTGGCAFAFALRALGAGAEYITVNPVTVVASGQKVNLTAGQKVIVMGINNGVAVIQFTLPDGSTSIAQSPESNFQAVPIQSTAPTVPAPLPVPAADQAPSPTTSTQPPPPTSPVPAVTSDTTASTNSGTLSVTQKTKEEADAIIDQAGNTAPDWWDSTPMTIPPGIDMSWKSEGKGPQDIGSYLWNVIQPNPGRWKEGVKLAQETLSYCKGDPDSQQKAFNVLSHIYTKMLGDYARGAFWAKKTSSGEVSINLAECYMKLGCPSAAIEILNGMGSDQTRNGQAIKLWSELGNLDTALAWAEKLAPSDPTVANLSAGDACRRFGKIPEALAYYQKVLDVSRQVQRDDPINKKRAAANIQAVKLYDSLDLTKIPDGSYKSDSIGYVGPVEITVAVQDHKITDVKITKHHEKQFYSSLTDVPPQIVAKQSVKGIDTTTGATITSEAIINATAKALSVAQNGGGQGTEDQK